MKKLKFRRAICVGLMAAAVAALLGSLPYEELFPAPARYASIHAADEVPAMYGFSADSVFNTGTAQDLEQFPGIGKVLSRRIVEGRSILGDYRIPEDLLLVNGIGSKTLQKVLEKLDEPLVELLPMAD